MWKNERNSVFFLFYFLNKVVFKIGFWFLRMTTQIKLWVFKKKGVENVICSCYQSGNVAALLKMALKYAMSHIVLRKRVSQWNTFLWRLSNLTFSQVKVSWTNEFHLLRVPLKAKRLAPLADYFTCISTSRSKSRSEPKKVITYFTNRSNSIIATCRYSIFCISVTVAMVSTPFHQPLYSRAIGRVSHCMSMYAVLCKRMKQLQRATCFTCTDNAGTTTTILWLYIRF